jgi:hypothetical protein
MVRIKTCRLTRNPQLGDPVAWLNLTLADERELDDVALHRSPGGRWFFQGWGWLSANRRPTDGVSRRPRHASMMKCASPFSDDSGIEVWRPRSPRKKER